MEEEKYRLNEVAQMLGKKTSTLKKTCQRNGIGFKKKEGSQEYWYLKASEIQKLQDGKLEQDYEQLKSEWEAAMKTGYHSDRYKVLSSATIENYKMGLHCFWNNLKEPPSIASINPDKFISAMANIENDLENDNDHFALRYLIHASLCAFTKFLIQKGVRSDIDYTNLRKLNPRRQCPEKKRVLQLNQLVAFLNFNESYAIGGRTLFDREVSKLIIMLAALAGLRRSEILNLRINDLDFESHYIHVKKGKSARQGKARIVGMKPELKAQLQLWLTSYRPDANYPHVLINAFGKPMNPQDLTARILRLAKKSKINISLHGLRATYATIEAMRGTPTSVLQNQLGHSTLAMTQIYTRISSHQAADFSKQYSILPIDELTTKKTVTPEEVTADIALF